MLRFFTRHPSAKVLFIPGMAAVLWYAGLEWELICIGVVATAVLTINGSVPLALLLACAAGVLALALNLSEISTLILTALSEHLLVVRIALFGVCLSLFVRGDLLAAIPKSGPKEKNDIRFAASVFCLLPLLGTKLRRCSHRLSIKHSWLYRRFVAPILSLSPIAALGFVDPADAVGMGRHLLMTEEIHDATSRKQVHASILCASVVGAMMPFSVWWFFFLALSGSSNSNNGFFAWGGMFAYGALSYLHGALLLGDALNKCERANTITIPTNRDGVRKPILRGYIVALAVIVMVIATVWVGSQALFGEADSPANNHETTSESAADHGNVSESASHSLTLQVGISASDMGYLGVALALLIALLTARAWTELRLPREVYRTLDAAGLAGKSWSHIGHGVAGVSEAILVTSLVLLFSGVVFSAVDDSSQTDLSQWVPWFISGLLVIFAGKPFVVFGIGAMFFGLIGPDQSLAFPQIQILAILAAFASQFAPASLSTDYLFGSDVESWADLARKIGWTPILIQAALGSVACLIAIGLS